MDSKTQGIIVLILAIAIFIGLIVLAIRFVIKSNRKKVLFHQALGQKLNLKHSTSKHLTATLNRLEGERNGHHIVIYEKIIGSGKNQQLFTKIAIQPTPFNYTFSISKEGFFHKIGKLVGVKDIEFGDEEFDKTFLLKSKDEAQFRTMMDFRMQENLRLLKPHLYGWISNNETTFEYNTAGGFTKQTTVDSFEAVLTFMEALIKNKR